MNTTGFGHVEKHLGNPYHNSQAGVISDGSHFKVVLMANTKLRNDPEKDFLNGSIHFLCGKKMMVNKTMEQWQVRTTLENVCEIETR